MSEVLNVESALKSKKDYEILYLILPRILRNGWKHAPRKYQRP